MANNHNKMGVLDTINSFLKYHHLKEVAAELKRELREEKFLEKIDEDIIKKCDDSIEHAKQRRKIIEDIDRFRTERLPEPNATNLMQIYTLSHELFNIFKILNEQEHNNKATKIRMEHMILNDNELFQGFVKRLRARAPAVLAELESRLSDYTDQRRNKETIEKLYDDKRWMEFEEGTGITIEKEINQKIKYLNHYLGKESELFEEAYNNISRGLDKAKEQLFLKDKANADKIKAAALSLKKAFADIPKQELYNRIDEQIGILAEIRAKELEKKVVFAKIESILTAEELLLIRFDLRRLKYDSTVVMRFPLVQIQSRQVSHFLVQERLSLRKEYVIKMSSRYKKEGKEIDKESIRMFINSDKVKQGVEKQAKDRLRLIQAILRSGPRGLTSGIYHQVIEQEDKLCSTTSGLSKQVMRAIAREFLTQKLGDTDSLTSLNFMNLLGYAFFMQLNADVLRKTFNTIPRIHHEKEEIDYISLTDSLIQKKFAVNLFDMKLS